ncbi:MAG: histidine phosphatase family protein [Treponema sp.]|nr:histidine phosphatase family protein [Treponema sp.]
MEEINAVFTFIRHGATAGNLEKRYIGKKTDESLCEIGAAKILENAAKGKYPGADFVFSSPMKRCLETCNLIYGSEKNPKEKPIIIEDFCETDFGDFEGKNFSELKDNPEYKKWIESGGEMPFPNGEGRAEAAARALKGFSKMLEILGSDIERRKNQKNAEESFRVAAVVHGGTVMAVLSKLTGKNYYDFQLENGGAVSFRLKFSGGKMEAEILP